MRLIFMGTAPFACPTLRSLLASSHQVAAVVTQPDRPRGRGQRPAASAVKTLALAHHLAIMQPVTLRAPAVLDELTAWRPDAIVVVAYGNILPPRVLTLPRYGCLNLHASLLPKYRGPAPIPWALLHGESVTGYTIIQMDEHVDTGPIFCQETCPILPDDDAVSLGERLAVTGAAGLVRVLNALEQHGLPVAPQPDAGASRAPKLTRELGRLQWHQPATVLHNRIRGLVPWPGATAMLGELAIKVWRASVQDLPSASPPGTITAITPDGIAVACGAQHLCLQDVQPANRRRMSAWDFAQGYHVQPGQCFAS